MRAEHLPCKIGAESGVVRLPLGADYSAQDVDHLVLAVTKVAHYLREGATAEPAAGPGAPA